MRVSCTVVSHGGICCATIPDFRIVFTVAECCIPLVSLVACLGLLLQQSCFLFQSLTLLCAVVAPSPTESVLAQVEYHPAVQAQASFVHIDDIRTNADLIDACEAAIAARSRPSRGRSSVDVDDTVQCWDDDDYFHAPSVFVSDTASTQHVRRQLYDTDSDSDWEVRATVIMIVLASGDFRAVEYVCDIGSGVVIANTNSSCLLRRTEIVYKNL